MAHLYQNESWVPPIPAVCHVVIGWKYAVRLQSRCNVGALKIWSFHLSAHVMSHVLADGLRKGQSFDYWHVLHYGKKFLNFWCSCMFTLYLCRLCLFLIAIRKHLSKMRDAETKVYYSIFFFFFWWIKLHLKLYFIHTLNWKRAVGDPMVW